MPIWWFIRQAIRSCQEMTEKLRTLGWRNTDDCFPKATAQPAGDLRAIRLFPPKSNEYFIEFLNIPQKDQAESKLWVPVQLPDGWYGLPSFRFLGIVSIDRMTSHVGLEYAHPATMALANLLSHPEVGTTRIESGDMLGILRSAKDLGRVIALAMLEGRDGTEAWRDHWLRAIQECFPESWTPLVANLGSGLEELIPLWESCCEEPLAVTSDGKPAWDDTRLAAARSIAKGDRPDVPDASDPAYRSIFRAVRPRPDTPLDPIKEFPSELDRLHRAVLPSLGPNQKRRTGQRLFEAIQAYHKYIGREYRDGAGKLTDNGKTKQDELRMLRSYLKDCDLGELDYHGCDELYGVFRRRPITKRYNKAMAYKTCQNLLGEMTRFFTWLHKSVEFEWRKPEDFDLIKKSPRETDEDAEKESQEIPTWKSAELKTLWEYALPLERVLFLLGLNCAYGADQAGRLRIHHVKFHDAEGRTSFIRRIRTKKKTRSLMTRMRWRTLARRPTSGCSTEWMPRQTCCERPANGLCRMSFFRCATRSSDRDQALIQRVGCLILFSTPTPCESGPCSDDRPSAC